MQGNNESSENRAEIARVICGGRAAQSAVSSLSPSVRARARSLYHTSHTTQRNLDDEGGHRSQGSAGASGLGARERREEAIMADPARSTSHGTTGSFPDDSPHDRLDSPLCFVRRGRDSPAGCGQRAEVRRVPSRPGHTARPRRTLSAVACEMEAAQAPSECRGPPFPRREATAGEHARHDRNAEAQQRKLGDGRTTLCTARHSVSRPIAQGVTKTPKLRGRADPVSLGGRHGAVRCTPLCHVPTPVLLPLWSGRRGVGEHGWKRQCRQPLQQPQRRRSSASVHDSTRGSA